MGGKYKTQRMCNELHPCHACGERKPASEFYKDKTRSRGIASKCKLCTKIDFGKRPKSPQTAESRRTEKRLYQRKKWSQIRVSPSRKAVAAVNAAVRRGRVQKPQSCIHCGKVTPSRQLHGHHHNGYDKEHWLDVVWLCRDCHNKEHKRSKQTA